MQIKNLSNSLAQPRASTSSAVHFPLLLIVLLAVIFLRIPLLDMPLERDEGGFAYIAHMMMQGKSLYTDLQDSKLPLLYLIYACFIKLFGYNAAGIHIGLLIFNLATIITIYRFFSTAFSQNIGLISAILYAVQSLNPLMLGFATHATQLLILPISVGLWLHYLALKKERNDLLFYSGLLIGLGFLIKQQAIGFVLFTLFYTLFSDFQAKKPLKQIFFHVFSLGLASITPYLICVFYMLLNGHFNEFWFWTIKYPGIERLSKNWGNAVPLFKHFFSFLSAGSWLFWGFGTLGLVSLVKSSWPFSLKMYPVLLLFFSFFSVATGYHFYPHYFIMLLLPVSLINALFIEKLLAYLKLKKWRYLTIMPVALFLFTVCQPIFTHEAYFINPNLTILSHTMYEGNPFVEAERVGQILANRSQPTDKIAVLGSEPEILVAANRTSALSQIYVYALVSMDSFAQKERQKAVNEIITTRPRFIVQATALSSWMNSVGMQQVESVLRDIVKNNYKLIGIAYAQDKANSVYRWDSEVKRHMEEAEVPDNALFIYELKAPLSNSSNDTK
jgi:hypothetical protein